ncbi:hydrogen peroxide-inducible genes activator [Aestuariispira ectoiniformans]|uniref:hydrogen peroxide-inducible genes activator n=1 Tax=Aestuariispira ectoiniformans TaxID=2775080 RepID=UPI00223B07DE|nr:hydrogen peroxide-inducible genes activator [Aestuariispira ectoiniformans]
MPLPTMRQLQYLSAVAEHLSFSGAADACFVTQSTLSSGIKELETLIGATLVERTRRKVMLTPLGRQVLEKGEKILEIAREIEDMAADAEEPLSGTLRLGVIPTIGPFLLPTLMPALQDAFPKVKLEVREDLSASLVDKLSHGQLDVVLFALPYDAPDLVTVTVGHDPFVLLENTKAESTRGGREILSLEELGQGDRSVLLLEDGHCLRDHALSACQLDTVNDAFRASSLHTLVQMVGQGLGVTLLPEMAVTSGILNTAPNLKIRSFADPQPSRRIGLAWRKSAARARDYKILADFLSEWLKEIAR